MDVYKMEAGRVMDALIAEHIFGWDVVWDRDAVFDSIPCRRDKVATAPGRTVSLIGGSWHTAQDGALFFGYAVPTYSTDIADAWEVVEHLRDLWTAATAHTTGLNPRFDPPFDDGAFFDILHRHADRRWPWAFLYINPLAICRAALIVLGPKEHEDPV